MELVSDEMHTQIHTSIYAQTCVHTLAKDYIDNDPSKSDRFRDRLTALIIPFNRGRNGVGTAFAIKLSFQLPLRSINVQSIPRNSIISCKSPSLRSLWRPGSSFALRSEEGRNGEREEERSFAFIHIARSLRASLNSTRVDAKGQMMRYFLEGFLWRYTMAIQQYRDLFALMR